MDTDLKKQRLRWIRFGIFLCLPGFFILGGGLSSAFGKPDPGFTRQEMEWMKNHPVIRVVVNRGPVPLSTWGDPREKKPPGEPPRGRMGPGAFEPPFGPPGPFRGPGIPLVAVEDPDKLNFRGIAGDYLKELSAITGIEFVVTFAAENNFGTIFEALSRGRVDLMPTYMLSLHPDEIHRMQGLSITRPYLRMPVVIVTRPDVPHMDDMESLKTMRVAGTLPTGEKLESLGLYLPFAHASPADGLMGVATGKFDAFICELPNVSEELSLNPVTNVKISGELPAASEFAMVVGPQIREFVPIFNKALDAIPMEKKDVIWRKWFRINYEKRLVSSPWIKF